jgi:hypothetical protein
MDDALLVRGFKSVRDLFRDRQCLVERDRSASNALGQIVALDEFHHQRRDAFALFQAVDGRNVRMIQRGEDFGLSLKSGQSVSIPSEHWGQNFDGDVTLQLGVGRSIHLAHAAFANRRDDFVDAEPGAWS